MKTIEPCCAERQFRLLRSAIENGGQTQFQGFGDLSLTELMPAMLVRYSETEMLIAAPAIPDQAAEIIDRWMKKQWARMDGRGKMNVIEHLTIIADLSPEQSPMASEWLCQNPFGDRLTLVDKAQDDTALLLPDIAITGPLNLRYGQNFTCDVTTVQEEVDTLWKQYSKLTRPVAKSRVSAKKGKEQEAAAEQSEITDPATDPDPTMGGESPVEIETPSAPASPEAEEKIQEE